MKTYVVTERHAVTLGPGTVFAADPADVAGALREGAIVEVQQAVAEQPKEGQAQGNAQASQSAQSDQQKG